MIAYHDAGGFIGYRVVVTIEGTTHQRYFSAKGCKTKEQRREVWNQAKLVDEELRKQQIKAFEKNLKVAKQRKNGGVSGVRNIYLCLNRVLKTNGEYHHSGMLVLNLWDKKNKVNIRKTKCFKDRESFHRSKHILMDMVMEFYDLDESVKKTWLKKFITYNKADEYLQKQILKKERESKNAKDK